MTLNVRLRVALLALILAAPSSFGQSHPYLATKVRDIYARIFAQIEKIPIFDHHAHPGFPDDPDVDAMAAPPGSSPLRERDSNPELVATARALFNYPYFRSTRFGDPSRERRRPSTSATSRRRAGRKGTTAPFRTTFSAT